MASTGRDLGDGLVLRWSTATDIERLVDCAGRAFVQDGRPDTGVEGMVRRYTSGDYPFMGPDDFALVEDTGRAGSPIVSCACYLREEWDYGGTPMPVARPEIVGTDPDYRRKGLVRAIFAMLHERSATDGTLAQGITGIQYFYRQFGYEYALDLGGRVQLPVALLPELPAGEPERYRLRGATPADLAPIAECYRHHHEGSLVSLRMPDAFWRHLLAAERAEGPMRASLRLGVVEARTGEFRGFVLLPYERRGDTFDVAFVGLAAGTDPRDVAPSLVRSLRAAGEEVPATKDARLRKLSLGLGRDHPLGRVLPAEWHPRVDPPYAWYLRIPDIPAFLRRIAPVLQARLAASPFARHTGQLALTLYREGLRLTFEEGRLDAVDSFDLAADGVRVGGGFPPLVVTQLLVGYRSLTELRASYPDVWASEEAALLLDILFPQRPSRVFEI